MRRLLATRHWFVAVGVLLVLSFGAFLLSAVNKFYWVGRADLEVTFEVTDAVTGQPIPNAQILVEVGPSAFCEECGEKQFLLSTDADGLARRTARKCMCFGHSSLVTSTWATHVPDWSYTAEAAGYNPCKEPHIHDVAHLATRPNRGEDLAHLKIPVRLTKKVLNQ